MKIILSFDAETNGLWGKAFAIGAVLITDGKEVETFIGRCPINEPLNPWVAENVLPQMADIAVTHAGYAELLIAFMGWYNAHKENASVIVHMGLPVEARLFLDAHTMGIIGDWDAPFPLIDISAFPAIGTSVDGYNATHGIEVPTDMGGTHNPLYDSRAAVAAYAHIMKN